jgi:hypothetical protein
MSSKKNFSFIFFALVTIMAIFATVLMGLRLFNH